jgi:putative glycosyltransferase (TIGR04348 family)
MRIRIFCPAPRGSRAGNRVTAERWRRILRGLGHEVRIDAVGEAARCDLLIALHARKSAAAVARYRRRDPAIPVVVALAGTDVYRDLRRSAPARRNLEEAWRIVALQPLAARELPPALRERVVTIRQSVEPLRPARPARGFRVAVLAHLRAVKDPFLPARAVRDLPEASAIRVEHAGSALSEAMRRRALREAGPRWRWRGELSHARAMRLLRSSRALVVPSRMEGGAHVVGEACVAGVPVLATRIPGNVGLLGAGYPGLFPVGDARALRRLLRRAEAEPAFLGDLRRRVRRLAPAFHPREEAAAWRRLLRDALRRA